VIPPEAGDDLSRTLNAFFGGDPRERFSSRCYRMRWAFLRRPRDIKWLFLWLIVDSHFRRHRGDRNHCRRVWREDRKILDA
jgi:hypothetical protein